MQSTSVLVVIEDELVRHGVSMLLSEPVYDVRSVATQPQEPDERPDVVITVLRSLEDESSIRPLLTCFLAPVVVVSQAIEVTVVRRLLAAGVAAVVRWDEAGHGLPAAIPAALSQHTVIPREQVGSLVDASTAAVSDTERAWLRALAAGETIASIAERYHYAERSLYRLLKGLYARLGVGTRTEAVAVAVERGLISSRQPLE